MKELSNEHVFYTFAPTLKPAMSVAQNEVFALQTKDCFSGRLQSDADTIEAIDWNAINPATGPVAIDGVEPGDIVKISVLDIELTGKSVMTIIPGMGLIKGATKPACVLIGNENGFLDLPTENGVLPLPLELMIGVFGLAPKIGSFLTSSPGDHGGNMDCNIIQKGASVFLKAAVTGGIFGCGDVHALMGDGEVLICGAETPAKITLSASVAQEPKLPTPFVETSEVYATIVSAKTAEQAYKKAVNEMFFFLTSIAGLNQGDAARLMGLVGNLRFCQVVDSKVTLRFEFPKSCLGWFGFKGIGPEQPAL
ncbi:MAG: acetamidase/formamidase family protein [Eubacteriaceae bacterium]|nr:acetamidase/formamidase family protein [Eubacteriaceae bacterium]